MASFSRLQLAAALLEYDNDPENPDKPRKSAYDSAIFAHLRRANGNIHASGSDSGRRNTDFLGVSLPSETGGSNNDKINSRRSKASVSDMLYNPFGDDEPEEEAQGEEQLEVDLASWGLDTFMPKEKGSKASRGAKGKAKSEILPKTQQVSSVGQVHQPGDRRAAHSRTMSMGEFGAMGAFIDSENEGARRNSISNPLDTADGAYGNGRPGYGRRFSDHPLIDSLPLRLPLLSTNSFGENKDSIPFPSSSPIPEQGESREASTSRPASRMDALSEGRGHGRTHSAASMGPLVSKPLVTEEPNLFAIPPPPPSRASRFDPKFAAHARTMSNATRLSVAQQHAYNDENEFHPEVRAPSVASGLDPNRLRDRRISAASFGTRDMLDDDYQSAYGDYDYPSRERRYSRLDLMRPKVLIMPSPLQNGNSEPPAPKPTRDGFLDSSHGRPMPPGAKASSSRLSMLEPSSSVNIPVASNSFTPNPRLSLSASQLLFRNTLMVDGERDVTYYDIDGNLQRAQNDGEQVKLEVPEEEPMKPQTPAALPPMEETKLRRPPGKLFGRSLIDDLEARKASMRGKARVFTGDQRPSMMDRPALKRSSTLIDPTTLNVRPTVQRMNTTETDPGLARRTSRSGKPLLSFGDDGRLQETAVQESRMPKAHSVFGVDTLWEREMEKLKEIEAQEKIDAEERKKQEVEEEARKRKKKGKKRKGDAETESPIEPSLPPVSPVSPTASAGRRRESAMSLSLPDIPQVASRRRGPPVLAYDDSDNESSASEAAPKPSSLSILREETADKWVSDDEGGPVRTTGVGPRNPRLKLAAGDDSDEDLPLSVTLQRASRLFPRSTQADDSDEDRPLSSLLDKSKTSIPVIDFDNLASPARSVPVHQKNAPDDEDEDDVPLGARMSHVGPLSSQHTGFSFAGSGMGIVNVDDDDRPLAMHPEQVRKSQYQMFAQAQAQAQQQQMFQAQMYNSMAFTHQPSMMFLAPNPAAFTPQATPVQTQETAKFGRVDKWRHDVAIEGQT